MVEVYSDRYTWYVPLNHHVVAHKDGFVSLMINWDGFDCEMSDNSQLESLYNNLYLYIKNLGQDYCAEFHWWRERDDTIAQLYLENNKKIIRGHDIAIPVRKAMAEHLGPHGFSNRVAVVLVCHWKSAMILGNPFARNKFNAKKQKQAAQNLLDHAHKIMRYLKGGKIATVDDYYARIQQSNNRRAYLKKYKTNIDNRFELSEQLVPGMPELTESGCLEFNGELTKSICLSMYPDAPAGWFLSLARYGIAMHVSFIVKPTHTRKEVDTDSKKSQTEQDTQARSGTKYTRKAINTRENFTDFVTEHGLDIFNNCFIIHLHGSQTEIDKHHDAIESHINNLGGEIRSTANVQGHFYRVGMPGMGVYSNRFRPDHTWQVGNMIPCVVYDHGIPGAEILRFTESRSLIGHSILKHKTPNALTIGMMGSGKDVDTCCEILECYPLGLNFYGLELGDSWKWTIEALGGNYTRIDPRETVVNPLIEYDLADHTQDEPIDLLLLAGTLSSISYLLLEHTKPMTNAEESAATLAIKTLYRDVPPKNKSAPTLKDLLYSLEQCEYSSDPDAKAGKQMRDSLKSFLSTAYGSAFTHDDNLEIHPTLNGIDLRLVSETSDKLLLFYMISICLRYAQLAFFKSDQPARVQVNEIKPLMETFPGPLKKLLSGVVRMGRKDGCSAGINTQDYFELENLDNAVVTGSPIKNLWWRNKDHSKISDRLENMPLEALKQWTAFRNPEHLSYRQGMKTIYDKHYNLYLTFPNLVLDIASTSREDLADKRVIEPECKDIFERIERLRECRAARGIV